MRRTPPPQAASNPHHGSPVGPVVLGLGAALATAWALQALLAKRQSRRTRGLRPVQTTRPL